MLCFHKELRIFSEQRCHDLKAACQSDYSTDSQTRLSTRLRRIREGTKGAKREKRQKQGEGHVGRLMHRLHKEDVHI